MIIFLEGIGYVNLCKIAHFSIGVEHVSFYIRDQLVTVTGKDCRVILSMLRREDQRTREAIGCNMPKS